MNAMLDGAKIVVQLDSFLILSRPATDGLESNQNAPVEGRLSKVSWEDTCQIAIFGTNRNTV